MQENRLASYALKAAKMGEKYTDITVTIKDKIGTIKASVWLKRLDVFSSNSYQQFNRPNQLNSFGGSLIEDTITALRELDNHPDTVFTVITGEGRFFSAGADVTGISAAKDDFKNDGEKKVFWVQRFAVGMELVRSMIDHKKVLVLALNGPGVGAGAAWFQGTSDLFYAAESSWLQVTFSQMGLVPENASAYNWAANMGTHRANDWLMFGGKASAEELKEMGMVNKIFPKENFHQHVHGYLAEMLKERDGKSMMEMKRLQNATRRDAQILALFESWQALSEKFVEGEPTRRMKAKMEELAGGFVTILYHFYNADLLLQRRERAATQRCRCAGSKNKAIIDYHSTSPRATAPLPVSTYSPETPHSQGTQTCPQASQHHHQAPHSF